MAQTFTMPCRGGHSAAGVLGLALAAVAGDGAGHRAFNPLVLVGGDPSTTGALLDSWFGGLPPRRAVRSIRLSAADVARDLAAALAGGTLPALTTRLATMRLVVLHDLQATGDPRHQHLVAGLVDELVDAGTAVCVTLTAHPDEAGLSAPLASRLVGGFVAIIPTIRPPTETWQIGRRVSINRVIRITARHHGLAPADLVGSGRTRSVVHARSLAMYLARRLTTASLAAIGTAFGGREHSTVLRSVRAVSVQLPGDSALARDVDQIAVRAVGRQVPAAS